jgi:hypothetical protein
MSATSAPDLVERAHDVVKRLSATIHAGGSGAHMQLICSELFEALQVELSRISDDEPVKKEMLSTALDLCRQSGDPKLKAQLRLAQLRAIVALLVGGVPGAPRRAPSQPRFRVIQGGLV